MNIENRVVPKPAKIDAGHQTYLYEVGDDEINLGDLLRNLAGEWKAIALVMAIGLLASVAYALLSAKVYLVETIVRAPTVHELGEATAQNLIDMGPSAAFRRFIQIAQNPETHAKTIATNGLLDELSPSGELTRSQVVREIYDNFALTIVEYDYYELEKGDKTPLNEVNLSIKTAEPEVAVKYLQKLVDSTGSIAASNFAADISIIKENKIKVLEEQIQGLTQAAKQSREAEIKRLEEASRETIFKLQQQVDLKIRKAMKERENRIIQLEEALKTANVLNIREPVAWDDLRPLRKPSQVTNEIGGKDSSTPLYFYGSRLLEAELDQLKSRGDDRPFVAGLTDLENQIIQAQNDPRIKALKARDNDTIYIEKLDDLHRKIAELLEQPTEFGNTRFAVVSRAPAIPMDPIRSRLLYVVIGTAGSVFLALVVALLLVSLRNSGNREPQGAITET